MKATADDVQFVARLVEELCGIIIDSGKEYLIESRLAELARAEECASYSELCHKARHGGNPLLQHRIIDSITTQETLFFRDDSPFQALQNKILPDIIDAKANTAWSKRLRIWSAASSTGQEAYSIAMTLRETIFDIDKWDVMIHATDISPAAIAKASLGRYEKFEIERGMKPEWLSKYFASEPNNKWRVKDHIRGMVSFQRRNLLEPFIDVGFFDVIFCRNVAIYFNPGPRKDLFQRIAKQLSQDGYLIVGSSESLLDVGPEFQPQYHCRTTFYQPNRRNIPLKPTSPEFLKPQSILGK